MKVKFFNIDYLFETDLKYQRESLADNDETLEDRIKYLDTIREVIIDFDGEPDEDELVACLEDETGEYFSNFDTEILA